MVFEESDYLQLSGLQHFAFCRRQWALIHIEQQWAENGRTADGSILHKKTHDPTSAESRGDLKITRGMYIHSTQLGISGQCDVVEFRRSNDGVSMIDWDGKWQPFPVEYKRGEPKAFDADRLQLCAQAMCLEEMLCCRIPCGALYYGEIRHREIVKFTEELRTKVCGMLSEMHMLFQRGHTPQARQKKSCGACSLRELCLPKVFSRSDVASYLRGSLEECP